MSDDTPPMEAQRYADDSISYPTHPLGMGGSEPVETIDLSEYTGEVITWTESTATPPGVRQPNTIAIVEFDVDGEPVRAVGQVADNADVEIGDEVGPVYVGELRGPSAGIREPESQEWDGYRFAPLDSPDGVTELEEDSQ
jgi:uncharacterized OB-fold protein